MKVKVECTNIKWAVEAEDVCDNLPENATDEDIEKEIAFVKQDLPDVVVLTLDNDWANKAEEEEIISTALSNAIGWLHEGFEYKIIKRRH